MQPIVKTTELENRRLPHGLTPKQLEVVNFIHEFTQRYGISPTYQEIGNFLGVNKTTVWGFTVELNKKRWISLQPGIARSIKLLHDPPCPKIYKNLMVSGKVEKREVFEKEETTPQIFRDILLAKLFTVSDESLHEYGIHNGDILIVKDGLPKNGSLVMISNNGFRQIIKHKKTNGSKMKDIIVGCISTF